MPRPLIPCLAAGLTLLTAGGQAQTTTGAPTCLGLQQVEPALAGQPIQVQLVISHQGQEARVIGGLLQDTVPCPLFKVFNQAGGLPLIERYLTADCLTGKNVTFQPGQQRLYPVTLPMKLTPGEYTVRVTLRSQPPLSAQATIHVGPGPFVTDLVLPGGSQAGRPLNIQVTFRNVWSSAVTRDLGLCGWGLLIRDEEGRTVYDSQPEGVACALGSRPTTVAAGGTYVQAWGQRPASKAGRYTAILWGGGTAVKRFEVKP